jgi:hypothetical protein
LSIVTEASTPQKQEIILRIDDAPPEEILALLDEIDHPEFIVAFGPWVHERLARRAARES